MNKKRLDQILVDKGWAISRTRAQSMISAGKVRVAGRVCTDSGNKFDDSVEIELVEPDHSYVSRGGLKLESALKVFQLSITGKIILDVGASTGGFTDCLLQSGAKFVYAVDVGTNQLADKLKNHSQVRFWEKTAIQDLPLQEIPLPIDFITVDVSFISLTKIIPHLNKFLQKKGKLLALIKPQYEAGKNALTRGGKLKSPKLLEQIFSQVKEACRVSGFQVQSIEPSKYQGADGSQEYFIYAQKSE